jgi:hypothetical protein
MATPAKTVQFRDIPDIMHRYEKIGEPACAIFHNGEVQIPILAEDLETGKEELRDVLKSYSKSSGIYTLVIFEGLPTEKINSKTPYYACFNFQLFNYRDNPDYNQGNAGKGEADRFTDGRQYQESFNLLMNEVRELKTQVKTLQDELEEVFEEDEPGAVGAVAIPGWQDKLLEQLGPVIPKLADRIADSMFPAKTPVSHSINGASYAGLNQEEKCKAACDRLKKVVPTIGDVLLKLADLGETNPQKLMMYVSMM